uniref:Uncharacterized protein LOC111110674 isoform X2 n=1 Tax=Crassostrea virginica TaxID=6565 RepID=A0A8B8BJH2_CRAVI|nr:uncharacterized protein LOC111110674 isoform X2 [Crassostrea virginica]XP_022302985.1 uncharacterized protein LOC111110674 isoform X2 [Crassostrea virginica]XP_022302986.1 uncharacterized protein LOC111110674 isoform X2 [Crassostrea virginica]
MLACKIIFLTVPIYEYPCRYPLSMDSSTTIATDSKNLGNSLLPIFITIPIIIIVSILVVVLFYFHRRKWSQHSDGLPPESESIELINEDSEKSEKEKNISFEKAKHYLEEKTRVVITGVQGTGKTYLAESLVSDMVKNRRELREMWISNFSQLLEEQSKPARNVDLYILDDIFYELQLESEFDKNLKVVNEFMNNVVEKFMIITVPSYVWRKHITIFSQAGLEDVHIDLNERDSSEKRNIMKQLMSKHYIHPENARGLFTSENLFLGNASYKTIGFPAVISWICKKREEEAVERVLVNPLQRMSEEIEKLKQSKQIKYCSKYVILSYITFNDGVLDINDIDTTLLHFFTEIFFPGFHEYDLKQYVKDMLGEYLLEIRDGVYKIDLNIWSKLVFVSVAKENLQFAEKNYKNSPRHIINVKDCPKDMDEAYPECFIKVNRVEKLSLTGEELL